MVSTPPSQGSTSQYEMSDAKVEAKVDALVTETPTESEVDLEFLYTRSMTFCKILN